MAEFNQLVDIQRNIASRLAKEVQMDDTIELMSIIQGIKPDSSGRIQKELVIIEATHSGMLEEQVLRLLDILIKNGTLQEKDTYITF